MRATRVVSSVALGLALVMVVVACGSSTSKASSSKVDAAGNSHGMTPQEMLCMSKQYAEKNPDKCPGTSGTSATTIPPYTLAHPLAFTADGLVDPTKVDLSGVQGVTPAQQKAATDLLVTTIKILPRWSDPAAAVADGFQSIGDGGTGEEHFLHWDWIDDNTIFDPSRPESLVYKVDRATGTKTLEAAMFILPKQYTLTNTPPIASPLVQFHQHDNLCFTAATATAGPQVRGLTDAQGLCHAPLTKFNPNIQVHVWIRRNDCGPFAALLGIGAGQIASGAERSCVHDHTKLGL